MLLEEAGYCQQSHDDRLIAIKDRMPTMVEDVIRQVAEVYRDLYGVDTQEINNGMCEDFACDVLTIVGQGEVLWSVDMPDGSWEEHGAHAFLVLDGRYYDSESPEGEDDWKHLRFFFNQ